MACGGGVTCGPLLFLVALGLVRRGTSARVSATGFPSHRCTISWAVEAETAYVSFGVETCRTQCTNTGPHSDFGYDNMFRELFSAQRLPSRWLQCSYGDRTFELPPPRDAAEEDTKDNLLKQCWEVYKTQLTDDYTDAGTVVHRMKLKDGSTFVYGQCDQATECTDAGKPVPCPLEGQLPSILGGRTKGEQANVGRAVLNHLAKETPNRAEVVQLPAVDQLQAVVSYLEVEDGKHKMKEVELRNFGIYVVGATPDSVEEALREAQHGQEDYGIEEFTVAFINFRTPDAAESQDSTPPSLRVSLAAGNSPRDMEALQAFAPPANAPYGYGAQIYKVHEVAAAALEPIWEVLPEQTPIVFAVDMSASMLSRVVVRVRGPSQFIFPTRFELVIEEIEGILAGLPDGTPFSIIVFNDGATSLLADGYRPADDQFRQLAGERLRQMTPAGGRNVEHALMIAKCCGRTETKAIYLVTSGTATNHINKCFTHECMPMPKTQGELTPIHATYFAPGELSSEAPAARTLLQGLAVASQGSYREPRWA